MCDMKSISNDPVNHPSHYIKAAVMVQPIELTARLNACLGQAVNYIVRAPYKNNEREDLEKAIFYLKKFNEVTGHAGADMGETAFVLGRIFAKQTEHVYIKQALTELFGYQFVTDQAIDCTVRVLKQQIEAITDPGRALERISGETIGPDIEEDEDDNQP